MNSSDELKMSVSPICQKDGKRVAYVSFSDSKRSAEGIIPECKITKNQGFSNEEAEQLEAYMKQQLATLKKMAASVNAMDAFLGRKPEK